MVRLNVSGVQMWQEAFLVLVILALLAWVLFSGGGTFRTRRIKAEINGLREELAKMRSINEALRNRLDSEQGGKAKSLVDLCELARDLEILRSAAAGSTTCQRELAEKYGIQPGPELIDRILATKPKIDRTVKKKLAHELLVGGVGKMILRGLSASVPIERAAGDAGVPVVIAKDQVKRLRILGYLDDRLKLTERGREALA